MLLEEAEGISGIEIGDWRIEVSKKNILNSEELEKYVAHDR